MIRVFFGKPGCGKTTLAVKFAKKFSKKYDHTFLNFSNSVPGCTACDLVDLGEWTFPKHSYIGVDEAGIEYNNRKFKSFPQHTIAWYKLHRHFLCDVDVFSQSWDDMDVTLRRLVDQLWYVYKIGPWTLCRRVYKRVTVDKNTEQIIDGYRMAHMLWLIFWPLQAFGWPFDKKFTLTYRPFYYKYFDTYEMLPLPVKDPVYNPIIDEEKKGRG